MPSDLTVQAARFALDGLAQRQRAGADNIANAETPGFLARKVSFESSLAEALEARDLGQARVEHGRSTDPTLPNGNNVDLTSELTGTTGLSYQLMTEIVSAKFKLLRSSMSSQ